MSSDADRPVPRARAPLSPLRILAALCLITPFVAVLWIPSYNTLTPRLLGFPFFYWYQLLWVILTAVLVIVAYWAVERDKSARRGGGAAHTNPDEGGEGPA